jgi:DNA transformation protein
MPVTASFVDFVLEQLAGLGAVSSRRMFGGVGLYCDGRFFGLIDDDTLYLRVDDLNRGDYVSRKMAPFRPYKDRPELSMSYYQAPVDVIEDAEQLTTWGRAAVRAAIGSPAKGRRQSPGKKSPAKSRTGSSAKQSPAKSRPGLPRKKKRSG